MPKKLCSNINSTSFQEKDEHICLTDSQEHSERRSSISTYVDPKYHKHVYNKKKINAELKNLHTK